MEKPEDLQSLYDAIFENSECQKFDYKDYRTILEIPLDEIEPKFRTMAVAVKLCFGLYE